MEVQVPDTPQKAKPAKAKPAKAKPAKAAKSTPKPARAKPATKVAAKQARAKPAAVVPAGASMAEQLKARAPGYTKTKLDNGKRVIDNGDELATALRGATLDEVYKEGAEHLGTTVKALKEKYGHLNVGQQRMNLGNRIRAAIRKAIAAE